jgi:hypothetical protein
VINRPPLDNFTQAEREAMMIVHAFTSVMVYARTFSTEGRRLAADHLEGPVFLRDDKAMLAAVVELLRAAP